MLSHGQWIEKCFLISGVAEFILAQIRNFNDSVFGCRAIEIDYSKCELTSFDYSWGVFEDIILEMFKVTDL